MDCHHQMLVNGVCSTCGATVASATPVIWPSELATLRNHIIELEAENSRLKYDAAHTNEDIREALQQFEIIGIKSAYVYDCAVLAVNKIHELEAGAAGMRKALWQVLEWSENGRDWPYLIEAEVRVALSTAGGKKLTEERDKLKTRAEELEKQLQSAQRKLDLCGREVSTLADWILKLQAERAEKEKELEQAREIWTRELHATETALAKAEKANAEMRSVLAKIDMGEDDTDPERWLSFPSMAEVRHALSSDAGKEHKAQLSEKEKEQSRCSSCGKAQRSLCYACSGRDELKDKLAATEKANAEMRKALLRGNVGRSDDDPCFCDPTGDGPHLPLCAERRTALCSGAGIGYIPRSEVERAVEAEREWAFSELRTILTALWDNDNPSLSFRRTPRSGKMTDDDLLKRLKSPPTETCQHGLRPRKCNECEWRAELKKVAELERKLKVCVTVLEKAKGRAEHAHCCVLREDFTCDCPAGQLDAEITNALTEAKK